MKIVLPFDSAHIGRCGVTDYTLQLSNKLRDAGVKVEAISIRRTPMVPPKLERNTILHIQYPSLDFRYSLGPHIRSWFYRRTVVTFHETATLNRVRQLTFPLFRNEWAVVTNQFDFENLQTMLRANVDIRKIALAPPFGDVHVVPKCVEDGVVRVCYFGLLRSGKNVEHVAKLFDLLRRDVRARFECHVVCGGPLHGDDTAFESQRAMFGDHVIWHVGTATEHLPDLLSRFDYAYLPFPNGADENRSSLVSALSLGVIPITYATDRTPLHLVSNLLTCNSPETAQAVLATDRRSIEAMRERIMSLGRAYSWDSIVKEHIALYTSLLDQ